METIKISYIIDKDNMTDEQFNNREERTFEVPFQLLVELVEQNDPKFNRGERISWDNFYIDVVTI